MSSRSSANRRRGRRPAVDLFPFLGIIVCVIGVVVLLNSAMVAAGSIQEEQTGLANGLQDQVALEERWLAAQETCDAAAALGGEVNQLQTACGLADEQIKIATEQLMALQRQYQFPETQERVALARQAAKEAQEQVLAQRQAEDLAAQIAKAKAELERSDATATIQLFAPDAKVRPIFVECHSAGLTIYRVTDGQVTTVEVPLDQIAKNESLAQAASAVAADTKHGGGTVLNFLIRPEGVTAYDRAQRVARNASASYSSVPLVAKGKIRFGPPPSTLETQEASHVK